jgi:uncharacterized protein YqjF (DUF2071 family)
MTPTQSRREALREMPDRRAVMRQRWAELAFFHWKVDPEVIAARLPKGLHVDTWDGSAWLGVVPFFMQNVRPVGLPTLPWLSWFLELNVRTYVYDDVGRAGVWFFSLDCNQPLAVELARGLFHLPYEHAEMRVTHEPGGIIDYACRRKSAAESARCHYPAANESSTAPAEAGTLEWFFAERYLLFAANKCGRIFTGQVHHEPYRVAPIDVATYPGTPLPLVWDGFASPGRPPDSAMVAAAVDVKIYPLRSGV